jgi:type IV pilus assembly protein PilC
MPKYAYQVQDAEERVLTGTMDGSSADEILDRLTDKNLIPLSVDELNFDGSRKGQSFIDKINAGLAKRKNKVQYKDVVFFTRQLATMVGEGVPLAKSLDQLSKGEKPAFKNVINTVNFDISTGYTFSDAIAKHPNAFNTIFVSVCRAGEIAGALDRVLYELADYMENIEALKSKVKAATRYPMVIAGLIGAMVLFMVWKLVPVFEGIYKSMNATLPVPTQILIWSSNILRNHFFTVILICIGLFALLKFLMTRDEFVFLLHKNLLKVFVFGPIMRKNILALYCRTMALLMEAGTPILKATEMAGAVVGNRLYTKSIEDVYNSLKSGELLSVALENTKQFPILVTQLVSTGEMSGKVDELLRKAAEFYEREITNTVDSLASIIEPILIVALGIIVGSILIALYLPVFMIGEFIG